MYESTINFTLDTICPWTYLTKRRLDEALRQVRETDGISEKVKFTVNYLPFQLYPGATQEGEDKYEWYKKSRYGDSEEKMAMYIKLMTAYGASAGIQYKFQGTVANTLHAHRLIQHIQSHSSDGHEKADKLITSLYRQYFEEEKHPSSHETLMQACKDAGIDEDEAKKVIENEDTGLSEVKEAILDQRVNGVDSVPLVLVEGKRRDFTFEGAREVKDYVKGLLQVVKEST